MRVSRERWERWCTQAKRSRETDERILAAVGLFIGALMLLVMFYSIAVARGWTGNY
jgi:hypothetical protein